MTPRNVLLVVTVLLCTTFLSISGQSIFPPEVSGEVGGSVTIFCVAGLVQDDNSLELYNTTLRTFINYETSTDGRARLSRIDDPNNNTLTRYTISPLRSTDNGAVFRCGTTGGNSTINVLFAPIIDRQGQDSNPIQVTEGGRLDLIFYILANPRASIVLMRNGRNIGSRSEGSNFSLVLDPVDRLNAGMYRLVVNNSVGTTDYNFTLDVLFGPEFPPNMFIIPNNLNNMMRGDVFVVAVSDGLDVTLVCNADGNPTSNVTHFTPQGSTATIANDDIVISGAANEDAGNYSCTAGDIVRNFTLFVGGVPRALQRVNVTIVFPYANIIWEYDDSVNGVPALHFVGNVTRTDGVIITTFQVPANNRTVQIDLRDFLSKIMRGQQYMASVAVRNLQGNSEAVASISFEVPSHGNLLIATPWSMILLLVMAIAAFY